MITGYVGLIGHGKTMTAVTEARRLAARRGAMLAANIRVDPPDGVDFYQLALVDSGIDLEALECLMQRSREEERGLVVLVDEVGIIMPARAWATMPVSLMYRLSQSRKYATDLIWTSQDEEDVDVYLRRKTQWVYHVRSIPSPTPERRERGERPWFTVVAQYRPGAVGKEARRVGRSLVRYRREREAFYDTDELVVPASWTAAAAGGRSKHRRSAPSVQSPVRAVAERRTAL